VDSDGQWLWKIRVDNLVNQACPLFGNLEDFS